MNIWLLYFIFVKTINKTLVKKKILFGKASILFKELFLSFIKLGL